MEIRRPQADVNTTESLKIAERMLYQIGNAINMFVRPQGHNFFVKEH